MIFHSTNIYAYFFNKNLILLFIVSFRKQMVNLTTLLEYTNFSHWK